MAFVLGLVSFWCFYAVKFLRIMFSRRVHDLLRGDTFSCILFELIIALSGKFKVIIFWVGFLFEVVFIR